MTSRPSAVLVQGVHKAFGSQPVLTGVDLAVPDGSITAIIGSSGSGKTTLLRLVAGFESPDAGSVTIGDRIVADRRTNVPVERRAIGYVSQGGSLFPHLDVRDNVGFGLARRHRRDREVDGLLEAVGLLDWAHRYPHQLSGGQQQRVALARALATKPAVILLDEPFSSLDANLRASVRTEVCGILRRSDATAIMVTHDQDEALSSADLVAVLRDGQIAQAGTPNELYDHPVDVELASFVGEANVLDGQAEADMVVTPFGLTRLFSPLGAKGRAQPVSVLVRPEQLELRDLGPTPGVRARILGVDFHGHDATVRLAPEHPGLPGPLLARIMGGIPPRSGAAVQLAIRGPVQAWPQASKEPSDRS
jgi:iron(III) transport system ATP-binding protein